jgi:hypothetical protein
MKNISLFLNIDLSFVLDGIVYILLTISNLSLSSIVGICPSCLVDDDDDDSADCSLNQIGSLA